jgi:hypothetical protein
MIRTVNTVYIYLLFTWSLGPVEPFFPPPRPVQTSPWHQQRRWSEKETPFNSLYSIPVRNLQIICNMLSKNAINVWL